MKPICKAVFPVAGLGTRFLPATRASSKEMLPIVDSPLIQYAVEKVAAAGINEMIFVTGRGKRTIQDHFDKAHELEAELAAHGKIKLLTEIRGLLPKHLHYSYVRQSGPLGLNHAVPCARSLVGDEPFAAVLADDLIDADTPVSRQMVKMFNQHQQPIVDVQNIPREQSQQCGIVRPEGLGVRMHRIADIVKKPLPENAPSTLGAVGRNLFTPGIFERIEDIQHGSSGEIQLTDGIILLLRRQSAIACEFSGTRYDCGSKIGYLKAAMSFALKHLAIATKFREFIYAIQHSTESKSLAHSACTFKNVVEIHS